MMIQSLDDNDLHDEMINHSFIDDLELKMMNVK